jgi:hypothetical protein
MTSVDAAPVAIAYGAPLHPLASSHPPSSFVPPFTRQAPLSQGLSAGSKQGGEFEMTVRNPPHSPGWEQSHSRTSHAVNASNVSFYTVREGSVNYSNDHSRTSFYEDDAATIHPNQGTGREATRDSTLSFQSDYSTSGPHAT